MFPEGANLFDSVAILTHPAEKFYAFLPNVLAVLAARCCWAAAAAISVPLSANAISRDRERH